MQGHPFLVRQGSGSNGPKQRVSNITSLGGKSGFTDMSKSAILNLSEQSGVWTVEGRKMWASDPRYKQ
jgi:hypothetical protein